MDNSLYLLQCGLLRQCVCLQLLDLPHQLVDLILLLLLQSLLQFHLLLPQLSTHGNVELSGTCIMRDTGRHSHCSQSKAITSYVTNLHSRLIKLID